MTPEQHQTDKPVNLLHWAKYIVWTNLPEQWGYPCTAPYTHTAEDNGFLDFYNIPKDEIPHFEHHNPQAKREWSNT